MNLRVSSLSVLTSAALMVLVSACAKNQPSSSNDVHPARQASEKVSDSFRVSQGDGAATNQPAKNGPAKNAPAKQIQVNDAGAWASLKGSQLTIKKSALGKAFLLSPTMVIAQNSPIIDHLQPKVVSFERQGSQLALFELNSASVYDNLPSDRLLENFEITGETEDSVMFQWRYGMSAVPLAGLFSGGASDFPPSEMDSSKKPIYPADKSFVRRLAIEDNRLEIEQVSEIVVQSIPFDLNSILLSVLTSSGLEVGYKTVSVKLNLSLRPYIANPNFKKTPSPFHSGLGAFEVPQTRKGDGRTDYLAIHWDLSNQSKPLTYATTKGTPKEYLEAIKEGVLYWNKVAGREIIRFESDADPNQTPTERKVLVHWIPWDGAGFARASMQADPLTGEILRADVYLTSAFATNSVVRMNLLLRNNGEKATGYALLPSGFQTADLCHFERPVEEQAMLAELQTNNADLVKRFVLDTLREVTAHEVGHTLGLRHNFAGSLHTEFSDIAQEEEAEQNYVTGTLETGAKITSSVMDYIFGVQGALVGAFIKNNALDYDSKFIEWFYTKDYEIGKANVPPFCSDGLGDKISGCVRGDFGTNTIRAAQNSIVDRMRTLENIVLHSVVMRLHPKNSLDYLPMSRILNLSYAIDLDQLASSIGNDLGAVRSLLKDGSTNYAVQLKVGARSWANEEAYNAAMAQKIKDELDSVGGVWGLIGRLYPMDPNGVPQHGWLKKKLMAVYERPDFKKGVTIEGVPYELSAEEDAFIGSLINAYADRAEEAWLKAIVSAFAFTKPGSSSGGLSLSILSIGSSSSDTAIASYAQQEVWWPQLAKLAEHMLTAREGSITGQVNGAAVQLPKAVYRLATRKQVVPVALAENYRLHAPELTNLKNAKTELLKVLSTALGKELKASYDVSSHVKTIKLDQTARRWLDDELEVLKEIDNKL